MTTAVKIRKAALVYQAGIANVFSVECFNLASYGREATRLYQGDFRSAEMFAAGLGTAGVVVRSLACNQTGDVRFATWSDDLDSQPFSDAFRPQTWNVIGPIE